MWAQDSSCTTFKQTETRSALWRTAQHFQMPDCQPDLWVAHAQALAPAHPEVALRAFERAIALAPDKKTEAEYVVLAGDLVSSSGDYVQAEEFYNRALALHPDLTDAMLKKGFVQLSSGHPELAVATLTEVLDKMGHDDYWTHRWLGIAYSQLGRPDEALPHLLRSCRIFAHSL